jgi:hypothetical protein
MNESRDLIGRTELNRGVLMELQEKSTQSVACPVKIRIT